MAGKSVVLVFCLAAYGCASHGDSFTDNGDPDRVGDTVVDDATPVEAITSPCDESADACSIVAEVLTIPGSSSLTTSAIAWSSPRFGVLYNEGILGGISLASVDRSGALIEMTQLTEQSAVRLRLAETPSGFVAVWENGSEIYAQATSVYGHPLGSAAVVASGRLGDVGKSSVGDVLLVSYGETASGFSRSVTVLSARGEVMLENDLGTTQSPTARLAATGNGAALFEVGLSLPLDSSGALRTDPTTIPSGPAVVDGRAVATSVDDRLFAVHGIIPMKMTVFASDVVDYDLGTAGSVGFPLDVSASADELALLYGSGSVIRLSRFDHQGTRVADDAELGPGNTLGGRLAQSDASYAAAWLNGTLLTVALVATD